jgi:hypothetical protein
MRLLKLLAEGHHYRTAAAELGISIHTVKFLVRGLYQILHSLHESTGPVSLQATPEWSYAHTRVNFATSGWTKPQSNEKPAPTITTVGLPLPAQ